MFTNYHYVTYIFLYRKKHINHLSSGMKNWKANHWTWHPYFTEIRNAETLKTNIKILEIGNLKKICQPDS